MSTASVVSRRCARRMPAPLAGRLFESLVLLLTILLFAAQAKSAGPGPVVQSPDHVAAAKAVRSHASDRVLVRFKQGASDAKREAALQHAGVRSRQHFQRSGVWVLHIPDKKQSVEETIRRLEASGAVEYAVPDQRLHALDTFPNDPSFEDLHGLDNTGQTGGTPDADIDAPGAWDIATGDPNLVVGVIDTGIDYTHPDLAANMWRNPGEVAANRIDDDGNGYVDDVFGIDCVNDDSDPRDDHFHGTHVAGTIGARGNDASGVVGVNWNVSLMALKFLDAQGSGFTSDAIECLEYATRMRAEFGIDVMLTSNSWGGGGFDAPLRDAIAASGDAGMLFVAAAGNSASDNDALPAFPASYDLPNIVAVAATDHDDALASFSNFGHTTVDLGAPGVDILSTFPGNAFERLSGTSMATPHVSGAAALVWAASPNLEPLQLKHLLMDTGDAKPSLAGRTVSGRRLNVANALRCDGATFATNLNDGFRVRQLRPVTIEAGLRDCGAPIPGASVAVTTPDGVLVAQDDGAAPDTGAGDGTYTTTWVPQSAGTATLVVDAQAGTESFSESASGSVVAEIIYRSRSVPFQFVDTSAGTDAGLHFDDAFVEIPIGFAFPFFGESHERVKISTNGFLAFGSEALTFVNEPMPLTNEPNGVIAPYWDDLLPAFGGSVRYLLEGEAPTRRLTVEWSQVPYFDDPASTATFQVTLHEGGRIRFQYLDVESGAQGRGASATVGLESLDGESALMHSFNQPSISNGTALLIRQAVAACNDGRDNDGDGLVDFPEDPECFSASDTSETPGSCGLLGIELLLVAPFARRWRRRSRAA